MSSRYTLAVFAAATLATALAAAAQNNPVVLKSPDGALELSIATLSGASPSDSGGQLAYRVSLRGKPVFDWSKLGLEIQGGPPLGAGMKIVSAEASTHDGSWSSTFGKANPIRDHYNAVVVKTAENARRVRLLDIEARAYDDGVAFRYLIPEQPSIRELRLTAESTQFRVAKEANTFPLILKNYRSSYEDDYHELPLSGLHPDYLIALPLLIEVPGVAWVGLTEAYIDNWAGLYTGVGRDPRTLEARLAPRVDEPGLAVSTQTPARSPWRLMMIAADPARPGRVEPGGQPESTERDCRYLLD